MAGFWERELIARRQREAAEQRRAAEAAERRRQQQAEEQRRAADAARLQAQAQERERAAAAERARQAAMSREVVAPATKVVPEVQQAQRESYWQNVNAQAQAIQQKRIQQQQAAEAEREALRQQAQARADFAQARRGAEAQREAAGLAGVENPFGVTGRREEAPTDLEYYTSRGQLQRDYENVPDVVRSVLFGEQKESVLGGEAGKLESFLRTQAGEDEFRTAGQRFGEGRIGAGIGWGLLGLAGAVPFFGDIVQGATAASRATRAAGAAGDVARGAERAADVGRAVNASEAWGKVLSPQTKALTETELRSVGVGDSAFIPTISVDGKPRLQAVTRSESAMPADPSTVVPFTSDARLRPLVRTGEEVAPSHVYRVMSREEFELARERGYIQSAGGQNLVEGEGTVFSLRPTGEFYAPASGDGVIVRVRYDDADGWFVGPEGPSYVKTESEVSFDRVDLFVEFSGQAADVGRGAEAISDVATSTPSPRSSIFDYGDVARYGGEGEAEFVSRTIEQRAANAKNEIALRSPASPAAQSGNEKTFEFFYRAIQDGPAARVDNSAAPIIFRAASDSGEIVEGAELSGKFVVGEVSGDFIDSPFLGVNELRTIQASNDPRASIEGAKDSFLSSLANDERNVLYRDASNSISAGTEVDSAEDAFRLAASRGLVYVSDASTGNPVRVPNEYFENSSYPANVGENTLGILPDSVNELAREIPLRGGDPALQEIYRIQGFDEPASVISRAEARNLEQQGYLRVYRGVNTEEPFDIVSDFATGEYYGGKGSYGNGTYTTRDELRASSYARYGDGEYETVMEIYVHPQARIMGPNDYARLDRERSLYLTSAEAMEKSPESARIVNAYTKDSGSGEFKLEPAYSDMGRLIAAMGYDGFIPSITYNTTKQPEIVILNRGVLSVVDSPVEIPR